MNTKELNMNELDMDKLKNVTGGDDVEAFRIVAAICQFALDCKGQGMSLVDAGTAAVKKFPSVPQQEVLRYVRQVYACNP